MQILVCVAVAVLLAVLAVVGLLPSQAAAAPIRTTATVVDLSVRDSIPAAHRLLRLVDQTIAAPAAEPEYLGYTPAPPDTPACFRGSETGQRVVVVEMLGTTAAADMALKHPDPLGAGGYAPWVATAEAMMCTYSPQPAGMVQDGFIARDEVIHYRNLQMACFNAETWALTPDLLLALAGKLTCPTGTSVAGGQIHLEQRIQVDQPVIALAIQIEFTHTGRVGEAMVITACESTWNNLAYNPSSATGSFQLLSSHANPGGSISTNGYRYYDVWDPGANAAVAAAMGVYDQARGAYFWSQWDCKSSL